MIGTATYQPPARTLRPYPLPRNPVRAFGSPYTWLATLHLMADLPVAVVGFTVVVTLLSVSFSLLFVALLGVPAWVGSVYLIRGLSALERARFRLMLGMDVPAPPVPQRRGVFRSALALSVSGAVWRQVGYHLVLLPWATVTFTVSLVAWALPATLVALPLYYWALPQGSADLGLVTVGNLGAALAVAVVGVALLLAAPTVVRVLVAVDAALCRALLGGWGSEELVERVDALEHSRRQAVDAADAERRRIERDLHDGAQQQLVSLAMTLGRAKARASADGVTDGTRELITEAHEEAKRAITELRSLTQGLHPPVLTDRGLDAALSALAARSPVPVDIEVDVGLRPSPTIEAMAYFVVAEALTNVAKHSGARRVSVVLRRADGVLRVAVRDDGMGGADPALGSGLAGIADRIAGVDGRLTVDSPPGGPTLLTVELPCES